MGAPRGLRHPGHLFLLAVQWVACEPRQHGCRRTLYALERASCQLSRFACGVHGAAAMHQGQAPAERPWPLQRRRCAAGHQHAHLPPHLPRLTRAKLSSKLRPVPAAVIPPFHAAVDRAISYLDREEGLLGVCDFFTSSK